MSKPVIKEAFITMDGRIHGKVYNDHRFPDGEIISTTPIKEAKTKNTEYLVEFLPA